MGWKDLTQLVLFAELVWSGVGGGMRGLMENDQGLRRGVGKIYCDFEYIVDIEELRLGIGTLEHTRIS